jgi:site-specific DNA recombinase
MSEQQTAPAQSVAVYLRVSGEDQRRKGTIENQRSALDRYALAHTITPYGWYEDEAVSGKWVSFAKRPQAQRLLADIAAGHVNTILVWKLDRFGRNAREILDAVHELNTAGAQLVSMKENVDTRTSAGIDRKLDGGGWMGGPIPYGYRVEGKEGSARHVLDEIPLGIPDYPQMTAADVVRMIYQLTVEEQQSGVVIAERLNALGVPTAYARRGLLRYRRGDVDEPARHRWRADSICRILSNPVYKGVYVFGRRPRHNSARETVTCAVPALVSADVWDAAQHVMERHQFWNVRNAKRAYLLRGFLVCGLCGYHYIGNGARYSCIAQRRATAIWGKALGAEKRCTAPPLPARKLEAEIWASVDWYIHHPDEVHAQIAAELSGQADTTAQLRAQVAAKQREQDALQGERDRIYTLHRKGIMTETDLTHQLDAIAAEQVKTTAQIAQLTRDLTAADETAARLSGVDAFLADLLAQYDAGPLTTQRERAILEQFVDEMTVTTEVDEETGRLRAVVHVRYPFDPSRLAGSRDVYSPAYTMVCKLPRRLVEK